MNTFVLLHERQRPFVIAVAATLASVGGAPYVMQFVPVTDCNVRTDDPGANNDRSSVRNKKSSSSRPPVHRLGNNPGCLPIASSREDDIVNELLKKEI